MLQYSLAKSQACIDGNKRIALILTRAFLFINQAEQRTAPGEKAEMILMAADSDPSDRERVIEELRAWFRQTIVPLGGRR